MSRHLNRRFWRRCFVGGHKLLLDMTAPQIGRYEIYLLTEKGWHSNSPISHQCKDGLLINGLILDCWFDMVIWERLYKDGFSGFLLFYHSACVCLCVCVVLLKGQHLFTFYILISSFLFLFPKMISCFLSSKIVLKHGLSW